MIETRRIETAPGLVYDVSVSGSESAPLVLMLHGFCVSRHFWDNQIPALAAVRLLCRGAEPTRLRGWDYLASLAQAHGFIDHIAAKFEVP